MYHKYASLINRFQWVAIWRSISSASVWGSSFKAIRLPNLASWSKASTPNTALHGVMSITVFTDVLYWKHVVAMRSVHSFSSTDMYSRVSFIIVWFNCFLYPSLCGWYELVNIFLAPMILHRLEIFLTKNVFPLSLSGFSGGPNLRFHSSSGIIVTDSAFWPLISQAHTNLVNKFFINAAFRLCSAAIDTSNKIYCHYLKLAYWEPNEHICLRTRARKPMQDTVHALSDAIRHILSHSWPPEMFAQVY